MITPKHTINMSNESSLKQQINFIPDLKRKKIILPKLYEVSAVCIFLDCVNYWKTIRITFDLDKTNSPRLGCHLLYYDVLLSISNARHQIS